MTTVAEVIGVSPSNLFTRLQKPLSSTSSWPRLRRSLPGCRPTAIGGSCAILKRPISIRSWPGRWIALAARCADLLMFMGELKAKGVDLYLHQQSLDTSTPAGKAMFQMLGVFSEFEREIIRERVNSGLARAKAQGKKLGRPRRDTSKAADRYSQAPGAGHGHQQDRPQTWHRR